MGNQVEIWKSYPYIAGIEVSTLGNVRTIDRVTSGEKRTRFTKGRILKQSYNRGYLQVFFRANGKLVGKYVHRLIAEAFIPNTDNFPQVNHKNCIRDDNRVKNLEWCTASYNAKYREKHGISQTEINGHPLFAVNLSTFEVSRFRSQGEASRELGVNNPDINMVIKGRLNHAGGYYFKEDNGNGIEINRDELNNIVNGMLFRGGVFAVNLKTLEVSRFKSQREAGRELGVNSGNISNVIKGRYKKTGGYWFVNDDDKADDAIKCKLQEIKKIYS